MKTFGILTWMAAMAFGQMASAQETAYREIDFKADSTGLPGDNFSLEAAMDLFKNSKSLDEFEKKLNTNNDAVNNLDLNGDGKVDYIRVEDHRKDNAHAIVLQVAVSATEKQDVAVIEIEKTGEKTAVAQIIGDEELYGEQKIVEPVEAAETPDGGGSGNNKGPSAPLVPAPQYVFVNVWFWPCVTWIYDPYYVVWVSPWYWGYYPMWWNPWPCYNWHWYHMNCYHYHDYYHHVYMHRTTYAHNQVYAPRRTTSAMVIDRNRSAKAHYGSSRPSRPVNTARPVTRPTYQKPAPRPDSGVQPRPSQPSKQENVPGVRPAPVNPPGKPAQPSRPPGGQVKPVQPPPPSSRPAPPPSRPPQPTPSGSRPR